MQMTEEKLQMMIETISTEVFGKPFRHAARINSRLRTTGGRYKLSDHSIEINPLVWEMHGEEELIGVIKHELCHYHLHIEGRGYRHGDQDFRELMKKTDSPRYCKTLAEPRRRRTTLHFYKCTNCHLSYRRKRRMDPNKYRCGKCAGAIVEVPSIG